MFRCEKTGKTTKPGEKMKKIILETRERVYHDEDGMEIGRGKEIVKEISVSGAAYAQWVKDHPEAVPVFAKKDQPVTSAYSMPAPENSVFDLREQQAWDEAPKPSALELHMAAVKAGKLVPVDKDGTITYVTPAEAAKHAKV